MRIRRWIKQMLCHRIPDLEEEVCVVCGKALVTVAFPDPEEVRHQHNPWTCPAHVAGCGCPTLEGTTCNPYRDGKCPDDIDLIPAGFVAPPREEP